MSQLEIRAGEYTESVLQFILEQLETELGVEALDDIEVNRERHRPDPVASEPVTIAVALIGLSTTTAILVARSIEKWIEKERQEANIQLMLKGFQQSDEAGKAVQAVVMRHANVSVQTVPELTGKDNTRE